MSSDRSSDCCLALFSVKENNVRYVNGTVVDCNTGKPVSHALLTVTDNRHTDRLLGKFQTDSAGRYAFEIHNTAHFKISAVKPGYEQQKTDYNLQMVTGKDSMGNDPICMKTLKDPENESKQLLKSLTRTSKVGNFAYKKAVLSDSAQDNLDSLASLMLRYPKLVILVEGYTDGIGGAAFNVRLAQKRVDACIRYLVRKGIPANRLVGKAMGECCPIEPETINGKDNPVGREINRRVEYKVQQAP
jgi:outer membrane protein OmpA-like peptidoglycan-associated protein